MSRKAAAGLVAAALGLAFFLPWINVGLSPNIWYPNAPHTGFGSITYRTLGFGAVFWRPNHYWLYFGPSVVQLTNSSASTVTVLSTDQHGVTIFGYYVIFSDSAGHVLGTGYTLHTFPSTAGQKYTIQVENYANCTFVRWMNGVGTPHLTLVAKSGENSFTAVYNC